MLIYRQLFPPYLLTYTEDLGHRERQRQRQRDRQKDTEREKGKGKGRGREGGEGLASKMVLT